MADKVFTVLDLLDMELPEHSQLHLKCIGGRTALSNAISVPEINRPGLALTGFYESFPSGSIQLFGKAESAYLRKLYDEGKLESISQLFQFGIPSGSCGFCQMSSHPKKRFTAFLSRFTVSAFFLRGTLVLVSLNVPLNLSSEVTVSSLMTSLRFAA